MENLEEINCREIFRNAYENRYTWNKDFYGYKGKCIFIIDKNIHEGDFFLGKDFKPQIQKIDDDKIVPGLSLLLKINGRSIAPVAITTLLALIFHKRCLILFFLSCILK